MKKSSNPKKEKMKFVEDLKRRWMATVDALVDPIMTIDAEFIVTKTNKAMSTATDSNIKNIIGNKCYKVFAKRTDPCPGCKIQETLKNAESERFDLDKIVSDRFYEVSSQPMFDSDGNVEGVLHIYQDRTEKRLLEDKLLQSEKLASIGLLAGGIAHELNNPLGGILIFSQMLLRELDSGSSQFQDAKEIELAAKRCSTIVESLLDFARAQPSTQKVEDLEDVDMIAAIQSALRFGLVGQKNIDFEVSQSWPEEILIAKGNRHKVTQLFLNLVQNAFHAMPDGGVLKLSADVIDRNGKKYGVFEVRDTGVGIDPLHLKKIFDPFYTSKNAEQGTGLGLSICHGIAEDMNAEIEVESEINQGTCFRIVCLIQYGQKLDLVSA